MANQTPTTYREVTYRSFTKATEAAGVCHATAYRRKANGLPLDLVFYKGRLNVVPPHSIPVTVRGVQYRSRDEACEAHSQKKSMVNQRLRSGWSLEDAICVKRGGKRKGPAKPYSAKPQPVAVRGVSFATGKAAAAAHGVAATLYYQRRRNHWTVEQALGLAPR